jgi:hypothetical protein
VHQAYLVDHLSPLAHNYDTALTHLSHSLATLGTAPGLVVRTAQESLDLARQLQRHGLGSDLDARMRRRRSRPIRRLCRNTGRRSRAG